MFALALAFIFAFAFALVFALVFAFVFNIIGRFNLFITFFLFIRIAHVKFLVKKNILVLIIINYVALTEFLFYRRMACK